MIVGDIRHFPEELDQYPPVICIALEHIRTEQLADKKPGKYELIPGGLMFALVQQVVTKPSSELRLESHEAYIDIQYVVEGEERIDVVKHSDKLVVEERDLAARDIIFYARSDRDQSSVVLTEGQFAIFYPSDSHRPCCMVDKPADLKKIVIKVHKSLCS